LPDNLFNVIAEVALISPLTIVPSTIFAEVIILSAKSALVKGTAVGLFPINGIINSYYVLIASTVETQTSKELAVSEITFKGIS
jgi:hypothetical protein